MRQRDEEQTYRESVTAQLDRIEADGKETKLQAKMTNGRVNKLERWQAYVFGFCACITLIILPIMLVLVNSYLASK